MVKQLRGVWQVTFNDGTIVTRCATDFYSAAKVAANVRSSDVYDDMADEHVAEWQRRIVKVERTAD